MMKKTTLIIISTFFISSIVISQNTRDEHCEEMKEAYINAVIKSKIEEYKTLEKSFNIKIAVSKEDIRKAAECSYFNILNDTLSNCNYFLDPKIALIHNFKNQPCEDNLPDIPEIVKNNFSKIKD